MKMKKLLTLIIIAFALQSCKNKTEQKQGNQQEVAQTDQAEEWLKNIFRCESGNGYCFYLDKEEQICTKRFYEFMTDSEEIYGASNLTENEYPKALKKYQQKWSSIYPLRNEHTGEAWLFGRGNDDTENIEKVEITKISDLKYSVYIDFGNDIRTRSEVTLVLENNEYKIDYCKTEFFEEDTSTEAELVYPKTGNKPSDFIPTNIFEIQYEVKGDLNQDGLPDIVIVLKNKESNIADRPTLILLQNNDKTYRLDKVSNFVMPAEYNNHDFKIYDTEDIGIDNGTLTIQLYGIGPSGNLFSTFKYFGNDLVLAYIETYNMGAGSHQSLYYDLEQGELTQEITNTMEEDMPSREKTFKLKKEKYLFETASPDNIISKAYQQIDTDW